MRRALLSCCLLAALLVPATPASVPGWTDTVQAEYDKLLADVRRQRWEHQEGAQPGDAELRLATFSAALLTRLSGQPDSWLTTQRRLQLQQNAAKVNMGKVELDAILSVDGDVRQEKVNEAFQKYLKLQKAMATSLGMDSARQLWWSPFAASSVEPRSALETMWSQAGPLVSSLTGYLRSRPAPAGRSLQDLLIACAAREDCSELVQLALPYPDVSNVVTDLLREKHMTSEQLAHLAEEFLTLLGLPAAPADFWSQSEFDASAACTEYVDSERMRLCADADVTGLKAALALMTDAEYLRTVTSSQLSPFQTPAFPGFERAVSGCVSLLSLQPSVVQQLVYGYGSGPAPHLQPVSLYLARGGRPSSRLDDRCGGDIGCQQTANALMEAAVTQLLPLGYHLASVRWLESVEAAPVADAAAAWRAELQRTLGGPVVMAAPAEVDTHFYDAGRHISRLISGFAGFQLRSAVCPSGGDCLPAGAAAAGTLLRKVMETGSSQPWDTLLKEATHMSTPSAAALVSYFRPLPELLGEPQPQKTLRTLELEDDVAERLRHQAAGSARLTLERLPAAARLQAAQSHCDNVTNKTDAEIAICGWNDAYDDRRANVSDAEWTFGLNVNDTQNIDDLSTARQQFLKARDAARTELVDAGAVDTWISGNSSDETALLGEMFILTELDPGAADNATLDKLATSAVKLLKAYTGVSVCPQDKTDCDDSEKMTIWELQAAMASGDLSEAELQYYWRQYRAAAKSDMASTFSDYISSGKDAAKQAGLDHYGQFWLQQYGPSSPKDETLLKELADTWADLDELYRSLHTFVRFQLHEAGISDATDKQPLPSHLLGDMFAADWRNIYNATRPFDNYTIDITDKLDDQSYDIVKIQLDAISYLTGLGLPDLSSTSCFSESSWGECLKGQDCDALAWASGVDDCVKIRVTNEVTMDNYERLHSKSAELGYYLEYMGLDPEYRAPANPAFMEAVAGAMSLSVLTPHHLKTLNLEPDTHTDDALYDIDFLYRRALQYLAPLPFSYVTQKWRWEVFRGSIDSSSWEHRWWELRENYQGVRPSEKRSESDADPLAVPDIARDRPAFQRYMATLLQFQLFEHLCINASQYDPDDDTSRLHKCDLTGNTAASDVLTKLMREGSTRRWKDMLEDYTEDGTLAADSMLRYFSPLNDHLQEVIKANKLEMHWESNLGEYWDEDVDNTVPIVVGVVLGVLVLIVVIAYFVSRARRNKSE